MPTNEERALAILDAMFVPDTYDGRDIDRVVAALDEAEKRGAERERAAVVAYLHAEAKEAADPAVWGLDPDEPADLRPVDVSSETLRLAYEIAQGTHIPAPELERARR